MKQKKEPIKFEVVEGPEMTPEQVEAVAGLLAKWIIDDWERRECMDKQGNQSGGGYQY